jgi:hypothetical protein
VTSQYLVSDLAQCPDDNLYTTVFERNSDTNLVQIGLGQEKPTVVAKLNI